MRATRPPLEIFFVFQGCSLEAASLTNSLKVSVVSRPLNAGHPRYFARLSWCVILNTEATTCLSWAVTIFEKIKDDLWKLINFPEAWQNSLSSLLRRWQDYKVVLQNNRLSSVKSRHGIFPAFGVILNPTLDFLVDCAIQSPLVRTSIQIRNK